MAKSSTNDPGKRRRSSGEDPTLQTMILDHFVGNNIRTLLASGREDAPPADRSLDPQMRSASAS
jgi:hypothetical protein